MRRKCFFMLLMAFVHTAFMGVSVRAQEVEPGIFQVLSNSESKIDRHLTCRIVKNGGTTPVMVPTNTVQEWSTGTNSFLTNISNMPGVTARTCGLEVQLVGCETHDPYGGSTINIRDFGVRFEGGATRGWKVVEQEEYWSPPVPSGCQDITVRRPGKLKAEMDTNMAGIRGTGIQICNLPSGAVWNPTTYQQTIRGRSGIFLMDFNGSDRGFLDGISNHFNAVFGNGAGYGISPYGTGGFNPEESATFTIDDNTNKGMFEYFNQMTFPGSASKCVVPYFEGNGDNPSVDVYWFVKSR